MTTFGSSENSFFRNRGCISVFDYRAPSAGTWERRTDCYPFQPASPGNEGVAIFVLNRVIYGRLQPWTLWGEEKAYNEKIAPYFEAGHEGPISLSLVDRLILLKIMEDPLSLAAMVRKSFNPLRE
ncbi:hypothetical protein [Lysobacter sp. Root916]|uniref:hypothetical protein n=1 Tax=Lysobacter sp. Root916 TaxID=1736606 RepID=UPI0019106572|nr:hypothetical protein [Lysobacter sp. Root916]